MRKRRSQTEPVVTQMSLTSLCAQQSPPECLHDPRRPAFHWILYPSLSGISQECNPMSLTVVGCCHAGHWPLYNWPSSPPWVWLDRTHFPPSQLRQLLDSQPHERRKQISPHPCLPGPWAATLSG